MAKVPRDPRLITLKHLIDTNYVTKFSEIPQHIPVTWLVKLFRTNALQFQKYTDNPGRFSIDDCIKLAEYLEVDEARIIALVHKQVIENKKRKK